MKATRFKYFAAFLIGTGLLIMKPAQLYAKHPFYVSVTEIKHVAKTRLLEISFKMFVEDIQDVLKQQYKLNVDFDNTKQQQQNDKLVSNYILKHFALTITGKAAALQYVGFEKENESLFCYFEVENIPPPAKVVVTNTILQDFKQEQQNILHVIVDDKRQSTKLAFPAKQASFVF